MRGICDPCRGVNEFVPVSRGRREPAVSATAAAGPEHTRLPLGEQERQVIQGEQHYEPRITHGQ